MGVLCGQHSVYAGTRPVLAWIPFILGCIVFAGGFVGAGRWLARAPRVLEPARCLLCEAPVDTDATGRYRCGRCGFDAERARGAPFKAMVEALRDLRVLRDELVRQRDWYRSVASAAEEAFDLSPPSVPDAPLLRDLVRDAPELLRSTSPFRSLDDQHATVVAGLACILVGAPITGADRIEWAEADFEARRGEALRRLDAWQRTLRTFHDLLVERLTTAMQRRLPGSAD